MKFFILILMVCFMPPSFADTPSILMIGDSHTVGSFGKTMSRLLRSSGNFEVAVYGSCGSIGRWWFTKQVTPCGFYMHDTSGLILNGARGQTPLIENLLETQRPDYVIVQLGGNYLGYLETSLSFIKEDLVNLAKVITKDGAKCLWVSPPDSRLYREQIKVIKTILDETISPYCHLINSLELTRYPDEGGDGVHYSKELGELWGKIVYELFLAWQATLKP